MAQELLYTSAPRGLKAGSRGFCTVEATAGLSPALVAVLESLSAYRHLGPPGDSANPVVWSHVTLSLGGRSYSVVSRVADAGTDYSGRTNKIAHHVALEPAERPAGGPAWLVGQPGVMRAGFDGEPRTVPPRRLPSGDRPLTVCSAWREAAGDAGWAGVLAEAFLADPNRPAYLVVPPGLDVRRLFEEAIALLPPDRRWSVTFTTSLTTLPQNVTCLWRAVLAGSKEAHDSRRFVQALRIDLTGPLGEPRGGSLVESARTGSRSWSIPPIQAQRVPAPASNTVAGPRREALDESIAGLDEMPPANLYAGARGERLADTLTPPILRRPRTHWRLYFAASAAAFLLALVTTAALLIRNLQYEPVSTGKGKDATDRTSKQAGTGARPTPHGPVDSTSKAGPPIAAASPVQLDTASPVAARPAEEESGSAALPPQPTTQEAIAGVKQIAIEAKKPPDSPHHELAPARFKHVSLVPTQEPERFRIDGIDISANDTGKLGLDLWFPRSLSTNFALEGRGSPVLQVSSAVIAKKPIGRITVEPTSSGATVFVEGADAKEIERMLSLAALAITAAPDVATAGTYLVGSSWDTPEFPDHFSDGKIDWKPGAAGSLAKNDIRVKYVSVQYVGKTYRFEADEAGRLHSEIFVSDISEQVRVPFLRDAAREKPPVISNSGEWQLRITPGGLWSDTRKLFDGSSRSNASRLVPLISDKGGQILGRNGVEYFTYDNLRSDDPNGLGAKLEAALDRETSVLESDIRKTRAAQSGQDDTARKESDRTLGEKESKLNRLNLFLAEYRVLREFARTSQSRKSELLNAALDGVEVILNAEADGAAVEIPLISRGN
jgi:hypothetical protein